MSDLFTYYLQTANCHFKFARGKPSAVGKEFHDYHEALLFLDGNCECICTESRRVLCPGDLVVIPKEHFHQFRVTEEEHYLRFIFGFRETPALARLTAEVMPGIRIYPDAAPRVRALFDTWADALKSTMPEDEKRVLLDSAAVQFLTALRFSPTARETPGAGLSPVVSRVLDSIDTHLAEELTVERLAVEAHVSSSALSHAFRKELGLSVYRYICEKRLSAVRQYVRAGDTLALAAQKSGFKDYAGFFRMYKKTYGENPSGLRK